MNNYDMIVFYGGIGVIIFIGVLQIILYKSEREFERFLNEKYYKNDQD